MSDIAWQGAEAETGLSATARAVAAAIDRGARAYPPLGAAARDDRLNRLTRAGAWTDAALALVESELPGWQVRRLERDGGEWYCTLSLHPRAPAEYDDAVDGRDRLLPLAILDAVIEASRRSVPAPPVGTGMARPPSDDDSSEVVWCDNTF